MKIQKVEVSIHDLGLPNPYSIAYKTTSKVESVLVKIFGDNGKIGLGASNPSTYVVGEDVHDTLAILQKEDFSWLVNANGLALQGLLDEVYRRHAGHAGVTAALDIALYDLFGKSIDMPIAKYLGQKHQKMLTSMTIGIKSVEETVADALQEVGRGFKILKIKTGNSQEEDIERLAKLREALPSEIIIRVDANQGYDLEAFQEFHKASKAYDLEITEQPLSVDQHHLLDQLDPSITNMIAADESVKTAADAFDIVKNANNSCGILNFKLMKTGGVYEALKAAEIAKHGAKDLFWGCNDESCVSISAALHAAFSCPHTKYLDLDGSIGLLTEIATPGFVIEDGWMRINGEAGFGCSLL